MCGSACGPSPLSCVLSFFLFGTGRLDCDFVSFSPFVLELSNVKIRCRNFPTLERIGHRCRVRGGICGPRVGYEFWTAAFFLHQ
ncbi:hypothetical protein B0H13DRAFT_2046362 [Mycena leptocephala]|nr:hypothetical protein B0H13DRAFT_2046362 [Mycena leptocephala]